MGFKDFYVSNDYLHHFETKERIWFQNDVVCFWYRFIISCHEYTDWSSNYSTIYTLYMFPDDESIHESRKEYLNSMKIDIGAYGILLKERNIKGRIDEKVLEKIANSIDTINIESKIKVRKYEKIKGLISGTTFFIG